MLLSDIEHSMPASLPKHAVTNWQKLKKLAREFVVGNNDIPIVDLFKAID